MMRVKPLVLLGLVLLVAVQAPISEAGAQSPPPAPPPAEASDAQWVAAVFANLLYVPIKGAVICPLSGVGWALVLVLSGGTHYNDATQLVHGGCGGKWVLRGEDMQLSPDPPR